MSFLNRLPLRSTEITIGAATLVALAFAGGLAGAQQLQCPTTTLGQSFPIFCRGQLPLQMNAVVPQGQISNYIYTFLRNPAAAGTSGATLSVGTCAWADRPVGSGEPNVLLSSDLAVNLDNAQIVVDPLFDTIDGCNHAGASCVFALCAANDRSGHLQLVSGLGATLSSIPRTHNFNGDGYADVAWRDTSGNTAIWLMNGTSILNGNSAFVANAPTSWAIVGQRDFNGDGTADLLWRDTSGNVAIWEMNGTSILNQNSSFVANVPAPQWSVLGTGDFNGDGLADILWQDTAGNVAIWEMSGTTILNQNSSFVGNLPGPWSIKGTGDFNGDGRADILWRDTSGNVAIWEMNGTTLLNPSSPFVANVPGQWSIVGTGDFNGDGMSDILWQDTAGNVAIWEMNGTTILNQNSSFVAQVPGQWSIQLTGDYNGDGKSDILWQDTSGNVAIWEMNGTAILNASSSFVGNVPVQWSVQHMAAE